MKARGEAPRLASAAVKHEAVVRVLSAVVLQRMSSGMMVNPEQPIAFGITVSILSQ